MAKAAADAELASTRLAVTQLTDKVAAAEQAVASGQLVLKKTIEVYDTKLESKKVEFLKLRDELKAQQTTVADQAALITVCCREQRRDHLASQLLPVEICQMSVVRQTFSL